MNSGADRPGCTVIGKAAFEDHTAFHVVDAGRGLYPAQHEITHKPGSQISLLRREMCIRDSCKDRGKRYASFRRECRTF